MKFLSTGLLLIGCLTVIEGGWLPGSRHNLLYFLNFMVDDVQASCLGADSYGDILRRYERDMGPCFAQPQKTRRAVNDDHSEASNDIQNVTDNVTESAAPMDKGLPSFPSYKVKLIKDNVLRIIRIADCFFNTFNISVRENGTIDGTGMKELYEAMDSDEEVKSLILSMVDACQYTAMSGYYNYLGTDYQDFYKKLAFFRCAEGARFKSCQIMNMRQNSNLYDLSEMAEFPGMSDDEKRQFISSGWANIDQTGIWDVL